MLTTDQIIKLSDHGLKRYRDKILRVRDYVHSRWTKNPDWEVVESNWPHPITLSEDQVSHIRHLDKVAGDVYREVERRKLERRKQRFGY